MTSTRRRAGPVRAALWVFFSAFSRVVVGATGRVGQRRREQGGLQGMVAALGTGLALDRGPRVLLTNHKVAVLTLATRRRRPRRAEASASLVGC